MISSNPNDDALDILNFRDMNPPNFVTRVGATLVFTPSAAFPSTTRAWTKSNMIERRSHFLDVGNAHLAEVQLQRLPPGRRQHVLDSLPDKLPVEDAAHYARSLVSAIKNTPPQPNDDHEMASTSQKKLTPEELEAYRRCLLVRAAACSDDADAAVVIALSMSVHDL